MSSYVWSFVGYGIVGVMLLIAVGIIVMMRVASKHEKRTNVGLPQIASEVEQDDDGDFFFESGFDSPKMESESGVKKPARSFFKKDSGTTTSSSTATGDNESDMSFFQDEDFDLTDGSDNTPSS